MARKSGFVRRHGVMRRETTWLGGVISRTSQVADGATLLTSLNAAALALRPFTVIRTRGVIMVKSDQVAASEPFQIFFGKAVVSDQSSAIGITAIPTPDTDSGSDLFFVFEVLTGEFQFAAGVGIASTGAIHRVIDSKAMRKIQDGQDLISVIESPSSATTEGSTTSIFTRTLVKLH